MKVESEKIKVTEQSLNSYRNKTLNNKIHSEIAKNIIRVSEKHKIEKIEEELEVIDNNVKEAIKEHRFFTSKKSENNYKMWRRANGIPVAKNKKDKRSFINTTEEGTNNLREIFQEYDEYKYVAAGPNSLERQDIVVDIDNENVSDDYIKERSKRILGREPSCIKKNPDNGHKQVHYFLEYSIQIASLAKDENGWLMFKKYMESHREYLWLVKAMNFCIEGGDLCYTGYICQNPYNNPEHTIFYDDAPFDPEVMVRQLKHFLFTEATRGQSLSSEEKKEVLKLINEGYLWSGTKRCKDKVEKEIQKSPIYKDETDELKDTLIARMNKAIDNLEKLNESGNAYMNSYDKRYFETVTQEIKNSYFYCTKNLVNEVPKDFLRRNKYNILQRVKDSIHLQYGDTGYTAMEEDSRILYDIEQITSNLDDMDWSKTKFSFISRMYSMARRNKSKQKHMMNIALIFSRLTKEQIMLSYQKKAEYIHTLYNQVSVDTIKTFIHSYQNALKALHIDRRNLPEIRDAFDGFRNTGYHFFVVNTARKIRKATLARLISNGNILPKLSAAYTRATDVFHSLSSKINKNSLTPYYNYKINDIQNHDGNTVNNEHRLPVTKSIPGYTVNILSNMALSA